MLCFVNVRKRHAPQEGRHHMQAAGIKGTTFVGEAVPWGPPLNQFYTSKYLRT